MKRKKKLINEKEILLYKINRHNYNIPFNDYYNNHFISDISNSWFNIDKTIINNEINIKFDANYQTNNTIIKCKKIIILPTLKQQQILLSWFESYRKMYNKTLLVIKQLIYDNNKSKFNFRYIRTNKIITIKEEFINETGINSHILDGAIKLACSSYKSANTNLKNKNIKNYRIRPIKQLKKSKIMDLEKCYFTSGGFCKNSLGKMKTDCNFNFDDVDSDSKLHYNSINNKFTLLIPIKESCKNIDNKDFISIDPGMKTFLTGISSNKIYKIGTNLIETVKTTLNKIDILSKINNKLARKKIDRLKKKNYNRITDLHWKSINFLLIKQKFKHVLIGNWSTLNMQSIFNLG